MEKCYILGIESSCDETGVSIVADGREVISSVVASQVDLHKKYGGVVPEIAARAHIENIIPVLHEALELAKIAPEDLSAVAVANCPGLAPALLIGVTAAKTLAWCWQKPLIGVNHVHCHLNSVMLDEAHDCFPAVALVVSGGHTNIYHCKSPLALEPLGTTQDDAAGEAFDKVAAILKLPYPGGPSIEKIAKNGNPKAIRFPRTMLKKGSLNFSFSGIKTAVLYHCQGQDMLGKDRVPQMSEQEIADIAASFQAAVVEVLVKKTLIAVDQQKAKTVLLGGGVAANTYLRNSLQDACDRANVRLIIA
ncbi:MAG: tRNA (adenosine(37)-N6)-threonylcarbamoyltransferase complex transferase subunit TsaD, partial [Phycisphaerae bacterium]|nr:tRNA (adenosine(37)-N6)-threonylcarbamoyltransferase complex transferase subunit TsaD [Phycisphaerae bacterium]